MAGLAIMHAALPVLLILASADVQMVVQTLQDDEVAEIVASADGRLIASAGGENVRLWSPNGYLVRSLATGNSNKVTTTVALSPDGSVLATGSTDGVVELWSGEGVRLGQRSGPKGSVQSVFFTPDGVLHSCHGEWDKGPQVLVRWTPGEEKHTFLHDIGGRVWACGTSPDGTTLAMGGDNNAVVLLDREGRKLRALTASRSVRSIAFSPDGTRIAAGLDSNSGGGTIRLWRATGEPLATMQASTGRVRKLVFAADGKAVIAAGGDDGAKVWGLDGQRVADLTKGTPHQRMSSAVALLDADRIVVGQAKNLLLFEASGKPVGRLGRLKPGTVFDASASQRADTFGYLLFDQVYLWSGDGQLKHRHTKESSGLAFALSPSGRRFAIATTQGIAVRDSATGANIHNASLGYQAAAIDFFDDETLIVAAARGLKKVDVRSGRIEVLAELTGRLEGVAIARTARLAAVASHDTIVVTHLDGRPILRQGGSGIDEVALSDNGELVAWVTQKGSGGSGFNGALVRDVKTDRELFRFPTAEKASAVAISPDGSLVAVGDHSGAIHLLDRAGRIVRKLEGHRTIVTHLNFSGDGRVLVSSGWDSTAKLWNPKTGDHAILVSQDDDWVLFTPDGYFDTSAQGGTLVGATSGMEAYPIDQLAIRNNRPDLILERLGLGSDDLRSYWRSRYERRVQKAGLAEKSLDEAQRLPRARIVHSSLEGAQLTLDLELTDRDGALASYNVWVNDVPAYGAGGRPVSGAEAKIKETLELLPGDSKVEVSARNAGGHEALRAVARFQVDGDAKGALYFVGFGVSAYQSPELALAYAAKDVRDLAGVLSRMKGPFAAVHTKMFLDTEVSPKALAQAKSFLQKAKVGDVVVLFVAGHGAYTQGGDPSYYFLKHDTTLETLATRGIAFDGFEDLLQGIAPRRKLFLLDTCESGELDPAALAILVAEAESLELASRGFKRKSSPQGEASKAAKVASSAPAGAVLRSAPTSMTAAATSTTTSCAERARWWCPPRAAVSSPTSPPRSRTASSPRRSSPRSRARRRTPMETAG